VLGENVSQTASFVVSGSADIGIVALSLQEKGKYVEIPSEDNPAIEQAAVVLKSSPNKETARQSLAFRKLPRSRICCEVTNFRFQVPRQQPRSQHEKS
jgi:molybdate transport system substrate-binding protein